MTNQSFYDLARRTPPGDWTPSVPSPRPPPPPRGGGRGDWGLIHIYEYNGGVGGEAPSTGPIGLRWPDGFQARHVPRMRGPIGV